MHPSTRALGSRGADPRMLSACDEVLPFYDKAGTLCWAGTEFLFCLRS